MKVGDRVVVIHCPRSNYGKSELGWTGVIISRNHPLDNFVWVKVDERNKAFSYEIKNLVPEKVYNSKLYKALK